MFKKLINFGKSLSFHIGNGMPKSTQEEINQRFAICEECKICGCNINKKRIFMNKLAWKDTSCPMSKW